MNWLNKHKALFSSCDFCFVSTLRPDEFEEYKIGETTTITFCMRELRAILNFAESMNINISANFDTAGKYENFHVYLQT